MALQQSTGIHKRDNAKCDNPQHEINELELSHIAGNIYDSLEDRSRDSHAYGTTNDVVADCNSKRVASSSLKVELSCQTVCMVAVAAVFVCILICTISAVIVYHVLHIQIAENERLILLKNKAAQDKQNASLSMALKDYRAENDRMVETIYNGLQTSIENLTSLSHQLATLDNVMDRVQQKQNSSGQQVAFTVRHTKKGKTIDTVLIFFDVILNVGDGYDQTTGRFRCPVAGIYLFSARLISLISRTEWTTCVIRKNGFDVAVLHSNEGRHDSTSVSVIFHLSVGEMVDVGSCVRPELINSNPWDTFFIGSLIQAD